MNETLVGLFFAIWGFVGVVGLLGMILLRDHLSFKHFTDLKSLSDYYRETRDDEEAP